MSAGPTRVLFIAGAGRSGTTLLGHILGQLKGYCFVGEAVHAHEGLSSRRCGCGVAVPDCDFWTAVRREAGEGSRPQGEEEFFALGRLARWRHLPLACGPGAARRLEALYGEHWAGCARQYAIVARASGADVIVDSSKSVPYGRALALLPGIELHVVHLVRDPRAVAYSRQRWKPAPDRFNSPYMNRRGSLKAAVYWILSNWGAEALVRPLARGYLRLRYDELVAHPRQSLEAIVAMVGGHAGKFPLIGERTVDFRVAHSLCGNPDRLRTGPVELRLDDEWTRELPLADRMVICALTWPFLLRYGRRSSP